MRTCFKATAAPVLVLALVYLGLYGSIYQTNEVEEEVNLNKISYSNETFQEIPETQAEETSYNLSTTCLRPQRENPRLKPQLYKCPVKHDWGTTLNTEQGKVKYSSKECSQEKHCAYYNVCVKKNSNVFEYYTKDKNISLEDFGWIRYRGSPKATFSWNYKVNIASNIMQEAHWVKGTSIFFDHSYANFCHVGHTKEFYSKLLQLRKLWPGTIDKIIYANDREFKKRKDAYQFCYIPCNEMRIAFEDQNWEFPTVYWLKRMKEYKENELTCFEKLLVPSNTNQFWTSQQAAEDHRRAALRMCNIPYREKVEGPKKILFYERGHERQILNVEEICESSKELGFETSIETDNDPDYCKQIATIHSADIIVSVDGSHNHLLAYARPGTVSLIVFPFNFRVPDWKLMGHMSGLRVLELMTTNRSYAFAHPDFPSKGRANSLKQSFLKCYSYSCRVPLRHDSTYVPFDDLKMFLDKAVQIWGKDDVEDCEKPLPWPKSVETIRNGVKGPGSGNWANYGYACNYALCEPSFPNCLCCHNPKCMEAVSINRGF